MRADAVALLDRESGRVDDVGRLAACDMLRAGAMTTLAGDSSFEKGRRSIAVLRACDRLHSGGVTLETIRSIAETGVNFISVGRITQSAPAVDIGLDYSMKGH